jgi:multidrug efflux system membrane fusion protein
LLIIERIDPIYADFTISQNSLSAVQEQMRRGSLTAEVRLPDAVNDPVTGQLTFVDNAVQNETGQVTLRATLPNPDHRFWPGRFVNIRLVLSTIPGAVLVPANAPQMSANGSYVYVVTPDSKAEQRQVSLGQRQGDLIVIEKGVAAGEKVVTNGQLGVTPAAKYSSHNQTKPTARRQLQTDRSHESLRAIHPPAGNDGSVNAVGDPVWRDELFPAPRQRSSGS